MENYTSGTGQKVRVHDRDRCAGQACVIHAPSAHHMNGWPTNWRDDRKVMERICIHGVGHPDPDDIAYRMSYGGPLVDISASIHGCDGCCSHE